MKKVRRIKILVTTREILVTRSETRDSSAGTTDFSICPVCSSHLAEPLPVSVATIDSPAQVELNGDSTTADIN